MDRKALMQLTKACELQELGKLNDSEILFRKILRKNPTNHLALFSLGLLLRNTNRSAEALIVAEKGTKLNPDYAPLWFLQGELNKEQLNYDQALKNYDNALKLNPKYREVLINSGELLKRLHREKDALLRFHLAVEVDPSNEIALNNYGRLLTQFKLIPNAIEVYKKLLAINKESPFCLGLLIYDKLKICDWMDLIRLAEQAKAGIEKGKKLAQTLEFMAIDDSSEHHYMCTRMFVDSFYQNKHFPLYNGEQYMHKKIKIAYVSPDFREHPVGHLMMEVVANHNREAFEITIISIGVNDNSEIRTTFEKLADIFVDAHTHSSVEIANYIHEQEIDIAIDLAGFTHDSRVDIFQRRPAPIQINYLGYPGTMAMDCYDYIIADRTVIPPADEKNYKEKVAYLDCCYLPIPYGKNVSDPKSKLSYGLPENGFIFCAFNHTYKIFPEIFQIWMKLLKENPESVIWLTATSTEASRNLIKNALDNGVSSERLIFAGRINSISEHLARYKVADLFLDTWPYNAHTTCADALSVGLPVVTLKGNSFPSKVAASLLEEVGLAELVSESKQEYFEIADKLAKDKNLLLNLRQGLQPNAEFLTKNLNSEFTKKLENLFTSLNRNIRQKDITNEVNV